MNRYLASRLAARPILAPYPQWIMGSLQEGGDWTSKVRRWAWRSAKRPFTIEWLQGLRVWVSTPDELLRSIFLTGYFEPNELVLLDWILRPGMTFVDIGANLGMYTMFAARKVGATGRVLAIEASQREFRKLRANVELNELSQVKLLHLGVSNRPGSADLLVADEERSGHNTLGAFCYNTNLDSKETVPLGRLDDIVSSELLERLDVIKIDIEGGELFAFQGAAEALRKFHPTLLLEMSDPAAKPQGSSSEQVWQFLSALDYRFFAFDEKSGLPVGTSLKPSYLGENLIAVHEINLGIWKELIRGYYEHWGNTGNGIGSHSHA